MGFEEYLNTETEALMEHMEYERKQKLEDEMADIYEREVTMQVVNQREMQAKVNIEFHIIQTRGNDTIYIYICT